jgi:hypothetical protein
MNYPAKPVSFLRKKSSGQAILLVILGMAVVLTVVLSVVSRTVTDVSITTTEEESSKAFSAAEAGIERLLVGDSAQGINLGNDASIQSAQALPLGENSQSFSFTETYNNGEVATVWFVSHSDSDPQKLTCTVKPCFNGSSFNILWSGNSAIEVTVYYDIYGSSGVISSTPNFSGVRIKRFAFDPNSSRRDNNNFSATSSGSGSYSHSASVDMTGLTRPLFARVRFLYDRADGFMVQLPSGSLPSQGRRLVSTGASGSTTRSIEVLDYYRSPLDIFEAGILSQGNLVKN